MTASKIAGRLRSTTTPVKGEWGRPGITRFPRHWFGVHRLRLPLQDDSWGHTDTPVVDLTETRRRYDAGWII